MINQHLHIEIEPTNICNTKCLHCPHDAISRPYGKMDWSTYQAVIDQILAYTPHRNFEFAGMGEPLLNPLIYRFVNYVNDEGVTSLTTNASALTTKNFEQLIQSGLGHLTISFNGDDPTIYELMMGGLNFERAYKNLQNAVKISQGTAMTVGANVSVTRQTQHRLPEIKRFLSEAGVNDIYFSKCHNRGGFLKGDVVCNTPPPPVEDDRCDIFTNTLFISWSGDVLSCCHDLSGSTALGNLNKDSLHEILNEKKKIAAQGVRFSICANCNDLYRFMNNRPVDGREIGDWVYDLYLEPSLQAHPAVNQSLDEVKPGQINSLSQNSSLTEWLYTIYTQEGKKEHFFNILAEQFDLKEKQIQLIEDNRQANFNALRAQLDEVLNSRSWKTIQHLQHFRLSLIPKGSQREKWFFRIVNLFQYKPSSHKTK